MVEYLGLGGRVVRRGLDHARPRGVVFQEPGHRRGKLLGVNHLADRLGPVHLLDRPQEVHHVRAANYDPNQVSSSLASAALGTFFGFVLFKIGVPLAGFFGSLGAGPASGCFLRLCYRRSLENEMMEGIYEAAQNIPREFSKARMPAMTPTLEMDAVSAL